MSDQPKATSGIGRPPRVVVRIRESAESFRADVEREFPDVEIGPLFHSVEPGCLAKLGQKATALDPTYGPVRLDLFLRIDVGDRHDPVEVADKLGARDDVVVAYVEPVASVAGAGDKWQSEQDYLESASPTSPPYRKGIDAEAAWTYSGGKGTDIGFIDIELDWKLDHADLPAGIELLGGTPTEDEDDVVHGTNTLGVVCATQQLDPVQDGVVGIAPECNVVGVISHEPHGVADAITLAADTLGFGDVILVEVHMTAAPDYSAFGASHVPVEAYPAEYEAIRLATALGVVVVEPAGNDMTSTTTGSALGPDGSDLHGLLVKDSDGNWIYGFRRGVRDSGAILVGAADRDDLSRGSFSNYAERVDCYAWGGGVHTTTTNAAGDDLYTPDSPPSYGGTSAASAIVAGAAIAVQGVAAQEPDVARRFAPRELRSILVKFGTPSEDPITDRIGVMPDLGATLSRHRLADAPDLYVRDSLADTGEPPSTSILDSPDIIVHAGALTAVQAAALYGVGTEWDGDLGAGILEAGEPHHVLVRVWNRGGEDASDVDVTVWESGLFTLPSPAHWVHVGDVVVPSVPAGDVMTLAPPIPWTPTSGFRALVALASHAHDPLDKSDLESLDANFAAWADVVARRNNVAQRFSVSAEIVDVFDIPDLPARFPFSAPEPPLGFGKWQLEVDARLPRDSDLYCGMGAPPGSNTDWEAGPETLFGRLDVSPGGEGWRLECRPRGITTIGPSGRYAREMWDLWLEVFIPPVSRDHDASVVVRQVLDGKEYGRVTWRFTAD